MSEATHKSALCKWLRAGLPPGDGRVFRHEDAWTGGIPDISISHRGRTLWVEVKLDRPGRRSKPTALQAKALLDLRGVLLTFEEFKDGTLGARVTSGWNTDAVVPPAKTKSFVYRTVADALLFEVLHG